MDYEIEEPVVMPVESQDSEIIEVVDGQVSQPQSTVADIVGQSSEEYTNKVLNKIQQAGDFVPEIKTLGLTTENLKKIFMGLGVLQLLMIAQKHKYALGGLAMAYYVWKQNEKKNAPMAGYYGRRR